MLLYERLKQDIFKTEHAMSAWESSGVCGGQDAKAEVKLRVSYLEYSLHLMSRFDISRYLAFSSALQWYVIRQYSICELTGFLLNDVGVHFHGSWRKGST